jgi:hypothetical protein
MRFPDKHAARDKHLLSHEREADRLRQAQWHAPIVPLAHPYRRGWVKTYVLREDVGRRPDAEVFSAVLKLVNRRVHARTRAFIRSNGEPILLEPHVIHVARWRALALPLKQQRLFALGHWPVRDQSGSLVEDRPHWRSFRWSQHQCHVFGYKLQSMWWLVEDIQPHLITHQRVELPEVRRRLAEIDAFMAATCGWERLGRLHGRSRWWSRLNNHPAEVRSAFAFAEQLPPNTPD